MLPPELADGELHRQDLLAQALRFQRDTAARRTRDHSMLASDMPETFESNAGQRAIAAAEDLIRDHQSHGRP
jgi:hypothetical protein